MIDMNCPITRKCYYCERNHNSALCNRQQITGDSTNLLVKSDTSVLLQTTVINVANGKQAKTVVTKVIFHSAVGKDKGFKNHQRKIGGHLVPYD